MPPWYPFLILGVGLVIVLGGILVLRLHAFLALIIAATAVSLLAPGDWSQKIPRMAEAFGNTAAGIGVVIALAAIIGRAMTESGAADRIARMFLGLLGEKRAASALAASGFVIAVPVFFDTVFYLLVPLARAMARRTGGHYVRYLVAAASCASAHALVPPTPGPLMAADKLGVDLGLMMLVGFAVAAPAAIVSLAFAAWCDRRMTVDPTDDVSLEEGEVVTPPDQRQLPGLVWSLAPIVVPVGLITCASVVRAAEIRLRPDLANAIEVGGNPNFALLVAAILALATQYLCRGHSLRKLTASAEVALMSGGVIVLITAAGGAFGAMLQAAQIGPAIESVFGDSAASGSGLLWLAFGLASLLKFAQGSSTAAMIVASGMMAAMIEGLSLPYHPVYLATAIGSGSLVGSWMNDSGFWIFAKMGGLTELQTLRTWSPLLALLGIVSMIMTLLLATLMPLAS